MKIAVRQINTIIGDLDGNAEKIRAGYRRAKEAGADLAVFPELSLVGYPPMDLVEKRAFREATTRKASELAAETDSTGLIFGAFDEDDDDVGTNVFNAAFFCFDGAVRGIQHKTLIPNYDVFDEVRYYESAKSADVCHFKGKAIGVSVCEDIWNDKDYWKRRLYPNDPVDQQIKKGADILINISASPYSHGKRVERRDMLATVTRDNKTPLAYACAVGGQTELIFDGASMCFDREGRLVKLGASGEEDFFVFDTEADYEEIVDVEGDFPEEVERALVVGLRDFFGKQGFTKAAIGLSGGIDSAVVAALATKALGAENVIGATLPSKYSSDGSVADSLKLSERLGIICHTLSIRQVVEAALETLAPAIRPEPGSVTEQNVQARARGLTMTAIANETGALLLATGNKSELAVGYATLYGDMAGALAPIGDVYKTDVYRIAEWINRDEELIPREIIEKAPSAELKPDQTDQDSLPPYETLDAILRLYLEENLECAEIVERVGEPDTVKRTLAMVDFNEFKRRQAAPALRVSTKAFGYGRRFPMVQRWRKR
jgi:NAD+ synthase (glutamine-hydrolysing)